jgi:RNA polymerase sigma factor (sigma-70 family)
MAALKGAGGEGNPRAAAPAILSRREVAGAPGREALLPGATDWADVVARVQSGSEEALTELYEVFAKGIRFFLCRQLGVADLDDKVHDTFLVVAQAIQRGELREPERLMGFVRTVVRRQVASYIEKAVQTRRDQFDLETGAKVADAHWNPEETAMRTERAELIQFVLEELGARDREILTRFYLQEQSQEQICAEMSLSETQFRLLKSRAKARFGELGRKKLNQRSLGSFFVRTSARGAH